MLRVSDIDLKRLRDMDVMRGLAVLSEVGQLHWKVDDHFVAIRDPATRRVVISVPSGMSWELVVTGVRWFDTRSRRGGGGLIDLWMHLSGVPFGPAVRQLLGWFGRT